MDKETTIFDYENAKDEIESFYEETQIFFKQNADPVLTSYEVGKISGALTCITAYIRPDMEDTANFLDEIKQDLFIRTGNVFKINRSTYIMLYAACRTIGDRLPLMTWSSLHPSIQEACYPLFKFGEYASAVDSAFKEVEERLRTMIRDCADDEEPEKISKVITEVFVIESDLDTGDVESLSGKKYRKGLMNTFCGAFAAYRNSGFHSNIKRTKNESAELIMLCSHFLFVLEGRRRFRV